MDIIAAWKTILGLSAGSDLTGIGTLIVREGSRTWSVYSVVGNKNRWDEIRTCGGRSKIEFSISLQELWQDRI